MRVFACLFVLPLLCAAGLTNTARGQNGSRRLLDARAVPVAARSVRAFVPRGWKIEGQVSGDLNRDGRPDAALQLIQDLPAARADGSWNERSRALVIAFKKAGGTYTRAAVAPRLLYCSTCGGALSDPSGGNLALEIKKGVLNVSQLSGSREATDLTQRFRYDGKIKRFRLIGEDVSHYDRLEGSGTNESANYLTGMKIIQIRAVKKEGADPVIVSTRKVRIPVRRRFIEEMDYER